MFAGRLINMLISIRENLRSVFPVPGNEVTNKTWFRWGQNSVSDQTFYNTSHLVELSC